jgi:hypothetical protein
LRRPFATRADIEPLLQHPTGPDPPLS